MGMPCSHDLHLRLSLSRAHGFPADRDAVELKEIHPHWKLIDASQHQASIDRFGKVEQSRVKADLMVNVYPSVDHPFSLLDTLDGDVDMDRASHVSESPPPPLRSASVVSLPPSQAKTKGKRGTHTKTGRLLTRPEKATLPARKCGVCKIPGHTKSNCPNKTTRYEPYPAGGQCESNISDVHERSLTKSWPPPPHYLIYLILWKPFVNLRQRTTTV